MLVEEEQLAISVGGYQDEGFDPGLAYFYLTLPPGGDPAIVERRVLDELQRVANDGVTEAELDKARNIILAGFWRGLATINGKASALGNFEVFNGRYEKLFELPDDIEEVTAEQMQEVAAKIFRPGNMTVGVLRASAVSAQEIDND
jgi:zinc protease